MILASLLLLLILSVKCLTPSTREAVSLAWIDTSPTPREDVSKFHPTVRPTTVRTETASPVASLPTSTMADVLIQGASTKVSPAVTSASSSSGPVKPLWQASANTQTPTVLSPPRLGATTVLRAISSPSKGCAECSLLSAEQPTSKPLAVWSASRALLPTSGTSACNRLLPSLTASTNKVPTACSAHLASRASPTSATPYL